MKFKVGDKITGIAGSNDYGITNEDALMKVLHVIGDGQIKVEVIGHKNSSEKHHVGDTYTVDAIHFKKVITMKFKVGDKVLIKSHIDAKCNNDCPSWNKAMDKYIGKIAKVKSIIDENSYFLDMDSQSWTWGDCMLEEIEEASVTFHTHPIDNKQPVYWECKVDCHNKFWAANIIEKVMSKDASVPKKYILIRKWGKIDTNGQTMEQEFADEGIAKRTLKDLIYQKERKGYKPVF